MHESRPRLEAFFSVFKLNKVFHTNTVFQTYTVFGLNTSAARRTTFRLPNRRLTGLALLILCAGLLALPAWPQLGIDGTAPLLPPEETGWLVDLESSSHIVRDKEDRLLVGWGLGKLRFLALYANIDPDFRDDRNRLGLAATYRLDSHYFRALVRATEKSSDDDLLAALTWSSELGGGRLGVEVAAGTASLRDDGFLVSNDQEEDQLHARLYFHAASGLEFAAFTSSAGTFDMMRPVDKLLERLPRSKLVGIETLADRYPDEDRVEDSSGASIGYRSERFSGSLYAKSGDQWIRGIPSPDEMSGLGGHLHYSGEGLELDFELDLRSLDPGGNLDTIERGRLLVDYAQDFGRYGLGLGAYVQGQSSTLGDLVDDYETAGAAARLERESAGGRTLGLWLMLEDDAPDFHKIARLAAFWDSGQGEMGLGVRADQVGRDRFEENDLGPFAYINRPLANGSILDAEIGFVGDEVFGRVNIRIKR